MDMCLLQVKCSIASWKNIQRPGEMSNCYTMEMNVLKRKSETFDRVWGPFTQLLGNVNVSAMLQGGGNGNP